MHPALAESNNVAPKVECIGPADATQFAVYLHGRDFEPPGALELKNRKVFSILAAALHLRVALPRGPEFCEGNGPPHCWGYAVSTAETKAALIKASEAAEQCFGKNKTYGLIGFSNGGYHLARAYRSCFTRPDGKFYPYLISIASGAVNPPQNQWAQNLSPCGHYALLAGKQDPLNQDKGRLFEKEILKRSGHFELVEFEGGHEVPEKPLFELLSRLFRTKK